MWKIPEREKITFIVFSTINRLCMKLEKMYCHMWMFWGDHYHYNLLINIKTVILSSKIVNKKSLKIPEYEKNNFCWIFHQKWVPYEAGLNAVFAFESFGWSLSLQFVKKHKKTVILAWKLWIKNPWKSLNMRKITFIGHHK